MLAQRVPEVVWLRVYHVTSVNRYLLEWLGFGFYHTSIELYNHMFAYGGHDYDFSGIVCVETNNEDGHGEEAASGGLELKERIPIGVTYYSMDEIDDIVVYFGNFWHGQDYDPFGRNCNNFAETFLKHVCDKEEYYYPSYINRFTKLGDVLKGWFRPLQSLFGEIVQLEMDEEDEYKDDGELPLGFRYNDEIAPIPGGSKNVEESKVSMEDQPSKHDKKSSEDASQHMGKLLGGVISTNQVAAIDKLMSSPKAAKETNKKSTSDNLLNQSAAGKRSRAGAFSPTSQKVDISKSLGNTGMKSSAALISQAKPTLRAGEDTQVDGLENVIISPKQNVKISKIIQQQRQVTRHNNQSSAANVSIDRVNQMIGQQTNEENNTRPE